LAGDLDHAKGEPEKTKNANGSGISSRQKIAEIKLSAYALWGPFATIPNQDGSGTRCAQTAFAKGVDSVFRLRRAQRGVKGPFEILNSTKPSTKDLTPIPYLSKA
jgi:hypothetical protein